MKNFYVILISLILVSSFTNIQAQTYVGSEKCELCHDRTSNPIYSEWKASGHPYKFTVTPGNEGPTYPDEAVNFQSTWLENIGDGTHEWSDIAGVIGGYGWKARFVGTDGHLIGTAGSEFSTGMGHNQFNFFGGEDHGWVDYHPGDQKIYNYSCFKCHTTGGDTTGTWLAGVEDLGTFSEGGIGCEACHGPGSDHITSMSKDDIDLVYEQAHKDNALGGLSIKGVVQMPNPDGDDINFMCGTCHNRDYKAQINASGGFIKHHEQWDELSNSKHGMTSGENAMTCITCHDPHKRTIWDGEGVIAKCTECHENHASKLNHAPGVTCLDCHMPYAAKSGTKRGDSGYKGDVRSHLFTINPSTESMFTEDGKWVRDDDERSAALSPHYACLGCHNDKADDNIPDKTIEQVAVAAAGMHKEYTADDYSGSQKCQACHTEKYTDWAASGHPYKFNVTADTLGPIYPAEAVNFQSTWLDNLGDGTHDWGNVAGVIGGYGWKARFVGTDGHIIGTAGSAFSTGIGNNQFNFYDGEPHGWVDYHPGDQKIYNYSCFKCHTTGGDTEGTWLEGVEGLGTFTEGGIGCEACHGPGAMHAASANPRDIDLVYEQAHIDNKHGGLKVGDNIQKPDSNGDDVNFMCGTCHNRDYENPINVSGGFIKHHEQWDEMTVTKHGNSGSISCTTCHDPHKRTIWDGEGIIKKCTECHTNQVGHINHAEGVSCIDCHMPYAAKSGTKRGDSGYKGDVRSHLWVINPSTETMFTEDGKWVKDDEERSAALSPHFACLGCHNDNADDNIPNKTIEQVAAAAKDMHTIYSVEDYGGSQKCQACHTEKYNDWAASGHPYKFNVTADSVGPVYPGEAVNYQSTWLDSLGDGTHDWGNVAGVIGGYGWKARFVGTDGHIIGTAGSKFSTGMGHNQFNFYDGEDLGWANYHPNDEKIYNYSCFKCHTTGGDTEGTWLEGVEGLGTFTEGGIGCEACHGPSARHAATGNKFYTDKVYEQAHLDNKHGGLKIGDDIQLPNVNGNDVTFMCGTCHNRDYEAPINASGGFIKHHEQWDELTTNVHGQAFDCGTCHDPHKRTIWDGEGIIAKCTECHSRIDHMNHTEGVSCIDCHMPYAAKSGAKRGQSGYKGDVRSHLFVINPSEESMFTEDGKWVKDDGERSAALSPHYACLGCHNDDPNDDIPDKTIEAAAIAAKDMHKKITSTKENIFDNEFTIFPNPSAREFHFRIQNIEIGDTDIQIFDIAGKAIYQTTLRNENAGRNMITWDGKNDNGEEVQAGFYFVEIRTNTKSYSGKLIKM